MAAFASGPVRLGTVGFGIMGERLLRAALAHQPTRLVVSGVFDPSLAARARLAQSLPEVTAVRSAAALLERSDAVHIASPPAAHLEQIEQAVAAGAAVFCEKPLATDVAAARAVVARVAAAGGRVAVNFPFASAPGVEQLAAWIGDGAIGRPEALAIEVAFPTWPRAWQMDAAGWLDRPEQGGFTREVVSHFLFLTIRLLGRPRLLRARATFPDDGCSERALEALLEVDDIPVTLTGKVGGTEKPDHNLWTLTGPKGRVRLRDWSVAERLGADGSWREAEGALPNERLRPLVLARQLDKLVALARGEAQNLATLEEAFAVQELVEAMLAARSTA
jgi:predicted dehydrogenase